MASYYRKFIPDFAKIATPFHAVIKKNSRFRWTDEAQDAMNKLKFLLTSSQVMTYPDFSKSFILETDASDFALGGVLSQKTNADGEEWPIGYYSRLLNSAEKRYSTIEKETLAIVAALKHTYVFSNFVHVRTDHKPLIYLLKNPFNSSARLGRLGLKLSAYNICVSYKKGIANKAADGLSRKAPTEDENPKSAKEEIVSEVQEHCSPGQSDATTTKIKAICGITLLATKNLDDWKGEQQKDQFLYPVIKVLESSSERDYVHNDDVLARSKDYELHNRILY